MAGFVEGSNAFAWPIALTHESSEKKMVEMEKGEVHVLNAGGGRCRLPFAFEFGFKGDFNLLFINPANRLFFAGL
jgi:hypothetical protein